MPIRTEVEGAPGFKVLEFPKFEGVQYWAVETPGGNRLKNRHTSKAEAEAAARAAAEGRPW